MSYWNIRRNCSVCQQCGMCDYRHEVEVLGKISGDYSPMAASLMYRDADYVEERDGRKNLFEDKEGLK